MEVAVAFSFSNKFAIEKFGKNKHTKDSFPLAVSPFSTPNQ